MQKKKFQPLNILIFFRSSFVFWPQSLSATLESPTTMAQLSSPQQSLANIKMSWDHMETSNKSHTTPRLLTHLTHQFQSLMSVSATQESLLPTLNLSLMVRLTLPTVQSSWSLTHDLLNTYSRTSLSNIRCPSRHLPSPTSPSDLIIQRTCCLSPRRPSYLPTRRPCYLPTRRSSCLPPRSPSCLW